MFSNYLCFQNALWDHDLWSSDAVCGFQQKVIVWILTLQFNIVTFIDISSLMQYTVWTYVN